ncbi:MAG TPA: ornithine cyclodeaminase family protein [Acidimicrobiia bacterium]|nr:ornithine cyclodeaminase family protein [Acidimicrobiia bacterium]
MLLLDAQDLRRVLEPAALRTALAEGYAALSAGTADVPTRVMASTPDGLLGAMPGYVTGVGLAAKLVSVFPANGARSLATHQAVVTLFDHETGVPLAIMDGEVITEMRTAGSSALACDLLAPADASVLTVVGAGVQARGHLAAFRPLRDWREIRIANRSPEGAERLAALDRDLTMVTSIDEAVAGADVVVCTTDSPAPVFAPASFTGSHLSSVGLHLEIPPAVLDRATVVVQTRSAVATPPPNGPVAVQGLEPTRVVELGEIVSGVTAPPPAPTVWVSVGNAMEDVVAARLAYDVAMERGIGRRIEL